MLIDAHVRHRRHGLVQHRVRRGGERVRRDLPRHSCVPRGEASIMLIRNSDNL